MKKIHQRNLIITKGLFFLGKAFMGVFFPFFIAKTFGLDLVQTLFLMSAIALFMGLASFPVNYLGVRFFNQKQMIQIGMGFHILFYILLSLNNESGWMLFFSSLCFVLFSSFFPPSFHLAALNATKDAERGNFWGNFQIVNIGANFVAPVITGFLLEANMEQYIIYVALAFFTVSLFFSQKIEKHPLKFVSFKEAWKIFYQDFFVTKKRGGFFADAIQTGSMMFIWPIFFKSVLGSFSLMGIIASISSLFEVIAAKFFGKLTDKWSAKKMLKIGVWARFFDIGHRILFIKFPHPIFVGGMNIFSGILGPVFQLPLNTRMYEVAEEHNNVFSFIVMREVYLGIIRSIFVFAAAMVAMQFGVIYSGIFLFLAGASCLWLRKF